MRIARAPCWRPPALCSQKKMLLHFRDPFTNQTSTPAWIKKEYPKLKVKKLPPAVSSDAVTHRSHSLQLLANVVKAFPSVDWYLVTDDDTTFVPSNLRAYLATLNPKMYLMKGKCNNYVSVPAKMRKSAPAAGGNAQPSVGSSGISEVGSSALELNTAETEAIMGYIKRDFGVRGPAVTSVLSEMDRSNALASYSTYQVGKTGMLFSAALAKKVFDHVSKCKGSSSNHTTVENCIANWNLSQEELQFLYAHNYHDYSQTARQQERGGAVVGKHGGLDKDAVVPSSVPGKPMDHLNMCTGGEYVFTRTPASKSCNRERSDLMKNASYRPISTSSSMPARSEGTDLPVRVLSFRLGNPEARKRAWNCVKECEKQGLSPPHRQRKTGADKVGGCEVTTTMLGMTRMVVVPHGVVASSSGAIHTSPTQF